MDLIQVCKESSWDDTKQMVVASDKYTRFWFTFWFDLMFTFWFDIYLWGEYTCRITWTCSRTEIKPTWTSTNCNWYMHIQHQMEDTSEQVMIWTLMMTFKEWKWVSFYIASLIFRDIAFVICILMYSAGTVLNWACFQ